MANTDLDRLELPLCPRLTLILSGPADAAEGGTGKYTVTVSGGTPAAAINASYTVTAGTASAGSGYPGEDGSGTVTIPANGTSVTFTVSIADDDLAEPAETLTVAISDPSGGGDGAILSIDTSSIETTIEASDTPG